MLPSSDAFLCALSALAVNRLCARPVHTLDAFVHLTEKGKLPGKEADVFEVRAEAAEDGVVVVRVAGEVDLTVTGVLEQALLDAPKVGAAHAVVVDLDELRFLDSSGVHALVKGYLAARDAGLPYTVRNANGVVARVLEITGVADTLGLADDPGAREYPKGA
jgi:anti-anti-sigma factor